MRIYVAGPMTGHPELNFPAFHAAATELRALGHHVENPAEINADAHTIFNLFFFMIPQSTNVFLKKQEIIFNL